MLIFFTDSRLDMLISVYAYKKKHVYNLGLALGMALKFYTGVGKGLKLKIRKIWRLIPTFVEVTGEKLVGGFLPPS